MLEVPNTNSPWSSVYFNVAFVNATGMETFQDRCYGDVKPGSETALGNLGGACQKEQYTWSLEKQPNGHYQLFIAYVEYVMKMITPELSK